MRRLFILLLGVIMISCSAEVRVDIGPDPDKFYIDADFELVKKHEFGHGGFEFLIRDIKDTTMYAILSNECVCSDYVITREQYYKYDEGDILHFDYLNRGRFFFDDDSNGKTEFDEYLEDY